MIQTYAGEAVQWECDDLGHLNMRHYMTKVEQARQFFFITLGLTSAFRIDGDSSVRVRKFTIRYLKESRPGARLKVETGLLALHDNSAEIVHIMTHYDGTVSATIVETVEHIYLRTGEAFGWPKRVIAAADEHMAQRPASATARGLPADDYIPLAPKREVLIKEALLKDGAKLIGSGVFQPAEIDIFSCVSVPSLLGRLTESVGNFYELWPEIHESFLVGGSISGALLELTCHIHRRASAGDAVEVYGAIQGANSYTRLAAYHLIDPVSGESWASLSASSCVFDTATRKLVKTPDARVAELKALAITDLRA